MTYSIDIENLTEDQGDDGRMTENAKALADAVVGHKIVSVEKGAQLRVKDYGDWERTLAGTMITLDTGRKVMLADTDDCCAYTELESFLLHPEMVDHVITGVGTEGGLTTWHVYADMGDVLELTVGWSSGNPFYYGYGFDIRVIDPEEEPRETPKLDALMAGPEVFEPVDLDKFATDLHDAQCMHENTCQRGKNHRDFYRDRAQILLDKLGPVIGAANVPTVVLAALEELD